MARKKATVSVQGNLVRNLQWAGLSPGDQVVINLEVERRRQFVFVAHVRNTLSGDEWVEVRGGRSGEAKDRSFRCEVVFPAEARRGARVRGPSLHDAPRLPL
ncbi:MAG: hypothetical protein WCG86_05970 [Actinomycetota bacterium]